jgi:outer membrane protein assembly factor BamB
MQPEEASQAPAVAQAADTIIFCLPSGGVTALRATDGLVIWDYPTSPGWLRLASSDKIIYLGLCEPSSVKRHLSAQVTALRLSDGKVLWRAAPTDLRGAPRLAVDGDTLFVVGDAGNRAVFALDAQTGSTRWMRPDMRGCGAQLLTAWNAIVDWAALSDYLSLLQVAGNYRLLAADGGTVYLSANNASGVHALDARTGKERWRSGRKMAPISVTPGETQVYARASSSPQGWMVAALRPTDGTLEHTLSFLHGKDRPLAISKEGILYLVRSAQVCALRISDGNVIWSTAAVRAETIAYACLSQHTLFYYHMEPLRQRLTVNALDRQSGQTRWEWTSDEPLVASDYADAAIASGQGAVYVTTCLGIFAFREQDGHLLWRALPNTDLSFAKLVIAPTA